MPGVVLDPGYTAVNKTKNLSSWALQLAGGRQAMKKSTDKPTVMVTDKCSEEKLSKGTEHGEGPWGVSAALLVRMVREEPSGALLCEKTSKWSEGASCEPV